MKKIKINLMAKLLACSIIVIFVLGGIVYYANENIHQINQVMTQLQDVHKGLRNIDKMSNDNIQTAVMKMMKENRKISELITMGIVALLLGVIVTRIITTPIKRIINGARKIADGDLTTYIEVNSRDELEELANRFNWMTEHLRKLVNKIHHESSQVNDASEQLSSISEEVAETVQVQAVNLEDNFDLMQEIDNSVEETARQINMSTELTTETDSLASEGMDKANTIMNGMVEIDGTTTNLNSIIDNLNTKCKKISEVIQTIDDIAEQTNILALNASIEAARAGTKGQGFAVVADEIRELATNVKESTFSIGNLIDDLQSKSKQAVEYIDILPARS